MSARLKSRDVFINCPFDPGYGPIFEAIVFCVHFLGFIARCAREEDDASELRLSKIERIIEQCRFGINDLSAVELDSVTRLPRFNMPLELGLFLGCKCFGPRKQSAKRVLVLDSDAWRYRAFISDISGQDIRAHGGDPERAIREVRDWLRIASKRLDIPGGGETVTRYRAFQNELPDLRRAARLDTDQSTFVDLSALITGWLMEIR